MKKALIVASILFVMGVLVVVTMACSSNNKAGNDTEIISLAPIHEVRVAIAESYPPQVIVYIKGGLPDGCTTLHEVKTERSGNTVNITVTTKRPKDAICTQVYGYFEENLNLGSDFTSGQTYTIKVNDVTTDITMP